MLPDHWGSDRDHATAMGRPEDPEPHEDPVIVVTIDWPGQSAELILLDWPSLALVIAPYESFLDRRHASLTVRVEEDGNVYVRLRYLPSRQEVAFHSGLYEYSLDDAGRR